MNPEIAKLMQAIKEDELAISKLASANAERRKRITALYDMITITGIVQRHSGDKYSIGGIFLSKDMAFKSNMIGLRIQVTGVLTATADDMPTIEHGTMTVLDTLPNQTEFDNK